MEDLDIVYVRIRSDGTLGQVYGVLLDIKLRGGGEVGWDGEVDMEDGWGRILVFNYHGVYPDWKSI